MFFFVDFSVSFIVWVGGVLHLYWERHGTSFRVQASMLLLGWKLQALNLLKGCCFLSLFLKGLPSLKLTACT